ncbi:hypothetical protein D9M69_544020 [compost metagenome]
MRFHGPHGLQNGRVVGGVAVVGREACGQHPALFLGEVRHRVGQESLVQRQLLVGGRAQQPVELLHEFGMGVVHAVVAHRQGG